MLWLTGDSDCPIGIPWPAQIVQVMPNHEIEEKRNPTSRLPRQIEYYCQIVVHLLTVKNSVEVAVLAQTNFARLRKYHTSVERLAVQIEVDRWDD